MTIFEELTKEYNEINEIIYEMLLERLKIKLNEKDTSKKGDKDNDILFIKREDY